MTAPVDRATVDGYVAAAIRAVQDLAVAERVSGYTDGLAACGESTPRQADVDMGRAYSALCAAIESVSALSACARRGV